jgi:diguanylate cyclase
MAQIDSPSDFTRRENGLRLVRRMYLPRTIGLALGAVAIGGVLQANGASRAAWAALFATTFVWPHVAQFLGRRSRDPYRTELRCLTVDSAFGGAWIAAMQFNLLPSTVLVMMLTMDKIAVGGPAFLGSCAGWMAIACGAVALALGFQANVHTSMTQIVACLPLLVLYPIVVGITTYRLARTVREQNRQLAEISRTDGLSGLLNRRYWEEVVSAEFQRCRRAGRSASLLMIDIDHFKSVNDQHGHPAGDEVIRSVAALLRDALREQDLAGRYGGEEFGVALPETGAAGAEAIAERIRKRIEGAVLERSAGIRRTASIGIAEIDAGDASHIEWIARADRALYSAKARGRNRSELFEPVK